ncbi:hypothetical protein WJU23_01880 [Prosthecobacter sp. SYSU 5D2]|uniref:hypothetical protein n=1 Tax=Prosthecobacter sp. SYSU 5D2 TaxID=3134134 RepID=UPI0031FEA254
MGFFDFFRRQQLKPPPTPFETLAAFSRFQNVRECSPDFYRKHFRAIDMTVGFLGFLGEQHPQFASIFSITMAPQADLAKALESLMRNIQMEQRTLDFIDSTMTTIMQTLLPVVQDPECC